MNKRKAPVSLHKQPVKIFRMPADQINTTYYINNINDISRKGSYLHYNSNIANRIIIKNDFSINDSKSSNPIQKIHSEFRHVKNNSANNITLYKNENEKSITPYCERNSFTSNFFLEKKKDINSINIKRNKETNNYKIDNELEELIKQKDKLTNENTELLEILNLNTKKNRELKEFINNYKKNKVETKLKYIKAFEFLDKKANEINYEIKNNNDKIKEITDIKKENLLLEKKILQKNEDFHSLNELMLDLMSSNENIIKDYKKYFNNYDSIKKFNYSELYVKSLSNEILEIKNGYTKLKKQYNELLEQENKQKDYSVKQKMKFITKDISSISKFEFETKVNELLDCRKKINSYYNDEIQKIKKEINNTKEKYIKKQKDVENMKEKYKLLILDLKEKIEQNGGNVDGEIDIIK